MYDVVVCGGELWSLALTIPKHGVTYGSFSLLILYMNTQHICCGKRMVIDIGSPKMCTDSVCMCMTEVCVCGRFMVIDIDNPKFKYGVIYGYLKYEHTSCPLWLKNGHRH